jgi:hypothetical protein
VIATVIVVKEVVIAVKEVVIVGEEVVIVGGLTDLKSWSVSWIDTVKTLAFPWLSGRWSNPRFRLLWTTASPAHPE